MELLIDYDYREEDVRSVPVEELAKFVLEREEVPDNTEVSIAFVDDEQIHELNREYRGIDRPTDVLSFECDGLDDDMDFDDGEVFELGDIIIAVDVAERQTQEYGTSFRDELSLLLAHGLLHLCGYDHIEDDEAEEMEAREKELLSAFYQVDFQR